MTSLVDLKRINYLTPSGSSNKPSLNYMSAKYKNVKFLLQADSQYLITSSDAANLPGIAHKVYGDRDYWWIIGLFNGIIFPESDLIPGRVLQIPSLTDINTLLSTQDPDLLTNILI